MLQALNHAAFLWLNAPADAPDWALSVATFFAEHLIWSIPLGLFLTWLRAGETTRRLLLEATASGLAGLLINQLIGLMWQTPRPFMLGLGTQHLAHVADSSFPSDHLTLVWAVAFSLLMHHKPRTAGLTLALLGLPVAWARIYLGVHFPLDMVGAALVAGMSAWLAWREAPLYVGAFYRMTHRVYRHLFAPIISKGWVRL